MRLSKGTFETWNTNSQYFDSNKEVQL